MNSNESNSAPVTDTATNTSSQQPESLLELLKAEAPLLSLPPGQSVLSPTKPLVEMTDEEMAAWHSKLRDHSNHMTMMSHQMEVGVTKKEKKAPKQKSMEDFV